MAPPRPLFDTAASQPGQLPSSERASVQQNPPEWIPEGALIVGTSPVHCGVELCLLLAEI